MFIDIHAHAANKNSFIFGNVIYILNKKKLLEKKKINKKKKIIKKK